MDIEAWLRGLSLERHAELFRANQIDLDVVPDLTDADLTALGVALGHRTCSPSGGTPWNAGAIDPIGSAERKGASRIRPGADPTPPPRAAPAPLTGR